MKHLIILFLILNSCLYSLDKLYIIPIEGDIEPSLTVFIRNGIEEARKENAPILFKINTFGGRVDSALQIATLIGSVKENTIAYIPADPEGLGVSWSAGALISLSCKSIYMAEGTSIGAAAPVYMSPDGTQMAEEKTVSAVRVQMASLAEKNGYPKEVALAMVDKDVELYEITVNGKPLLKTKEDMSEGEEGKIISPAGKLLTLSARDMEYYGLSSGTVGEFNELLEILEVNPIQLHYFEKDIPDQIIAFITSTAVLSLLMTIGLITLYLAITSPGFGVLGTIGVICFSIVFIGGQLLGTLGSLELILFLLGVALLAVEIFVIPGFGITGISGLICIVLALILSQQDFIIPKWEWQWDLFNRNLLIVVGSVIGSTILIFILMSLFPRISLFNRLILNTTSPEPDKPEESKQEEVQTTYGTSITILRPVGKVKVNGKTVVGESQGKIIEKNKKVRVLKDLGNRVIVKEVSDEATL